MKNTSRVLAVLFVVALIVLPLLTLVGCASTGDPSSAAQNRDRIVATARSLGDAYVRLKAADLLRREAPHLLTIVDRNGDGIVTLAEVEGLAVDAFADPLVATIIIVAVEEAVRDR